MSGIATAIIVESRPSIKKAQPMTSGIRILSRGSRAEPEEGVVVVTSAVIARIPVDTKRRQTIAGREPRRD